MCVQLKAVQSDGTLYMVFYFLTRPALDRYSCTKAVVLNPGDGAGIVLCNQEGTSVVNIAVPHSPAACQPKICQLIGRVRARRSDHC